MRGKYAAFMAALGIAWLFLVRFLGSVFPSLFTHMFVNRLTGVLSVLAAAAVLYFYIAFVRDYVEKDQQRLKKAAVWAAAGNCAVLVMYFGTMHNVLNWRILPELFSAAWFFYLAPILPWICALCVFAFFYVFFLEKGHNERRHLPRAKLAALIGAGLSLLLRSIIVVVYLSGGTLRWASDLPSSLNLFTFSLAVVIFLATEFFFLSFYQDRDLI